MIVGVITEGKIQNMRRKGMKVRNVMGQHHLAVEIRGERKERRPTERVSLVLSAINQVTSRTNVDRGIPRHVVLFHHQGR